MNLWFEGSEPPVTPAADLAAQVVCSGSVLDLKYRALRAQRSQTRALEDAVGSEAYRSWWSTESFVAAERVTSATDGPGRPGSSYAGRRPLRRPESA